MAQKIQLLLIDDLDGSPADGTVGFALDGTCYEIDLSAEHARALRDALARRRREPVSGLDPTEVRERARRRVSR